MEKKLKDILDFAAEAGSQNTLSTLDVREWLANYLVRYNKEVERFPEMTRKPHFDLIMADFDKLRDAQFVAAVFSDEAISLVAGRGNGAIIRTFAESDFPEDVLEVIPDLNRRFRLFNQPMVASRSDLDLWLKG